MNIGSGPIIGQILKNIAPPSSSKTDSEQKINTSTSFVPFHFQHPFPGTATISMAAEVSESPRQPNSNDPVQGQSESLYTTDIERQSIGSQGQGEPQTTLPADLSIVPGKNIIKGVKLDRDSDSYFVSIECPSNMMKTVRAEIVDIDPAVFDQEQFKLQRSLSLDSHTGNDLVNVSWREGQGGQVGVLKEVSTETAASGSHVTGSGQGRLGGSTQGQGRFVCECCDARFPEYHQLILHGNIHLMESSRLKCEKCGQKFRSHLSYGKHMKEEHNDDEDDITGPSVNMSSLNPRTFRCQSCDIGFRFKCYLNKHFRSRGHFMNLEITGQLEHGTWEKVKDRVSELNITDYDSVLDSVVAILKSANEMPEEDKMESEEAGMKKVIVESIDQASQVLMEGDNDMLHAIGKEAAADDDDHIVQDDDGEDCDIYSEAGAEDLQKLKPHLCGLCRKGFESVSQLKVRMMVHFLSIMV